MNTYPPTRKWWFAEAENGYVIGSGDIEIAHVSSSREVAQLMTKAPELLDLVKWLLPAYLQALAEASCTEEEPHISTVAGQKIAEARALIKALTP